MEVEDKDLKIVVSNNQEIRQAVRNLIRQLQLGKSFSILDYKRKLGLKVRLTQQVVHGEVKSLENTGHIKRISNGVYEKIAELEPESVISNKNSIKNINLIPFSSEDENKNILNIAGIPGKESVKFMDLRLAWMTSSANDRKRFLKLIIEERYLESCKLGQRDLDS